MAMEQRWLESKKRGENGTKWGERKGLSEPQRLRGPLGDHLGKYSPSTREMYSIAILDLIAHVQK